MTMVAKLFPVVLLLLSGCTPAARNVSASPATPAADEAPMDYIYALQVVVRNWGVVTYGRNGHSRNLAITEGNAVSDESGVTFTTPDRGTFRCLYKDTPAPVIKTNFRSPPKSVVLNCQRSGQSNDIRVWDTEAESKTFAHAWRTMAAGVPVEMGGNTGAFEALAASYRSDPSAYIVTENVRELRVQAETAIQQKKFFHAMQRFREALDISPWWPQGHFNLALIYSELDLNRLAIIEMEKYLKLVPDAPNLRAAQDKIYSWRGKLAR